MKVLTSQLVTKTRIIKKFDVASNVPAWPFVEHTCPGCQWKIGGSSRDIFAETVVIAKAREEQVIAHPNCFKKEKVDRWV